VRRRARSLVAAVTIVLSAVIPPPTSWAADAVSISLGSSSVAFGGSLAPVGAGGGLTFKVDCAGTGPIDATITIRMAVGSGAAQFAFSSSSVTGTVDVTSAEGDKQVLQLFAGGSINAGELLPMTVAVAKNDGTVYQGVITVGVVVLSRDCFVNGVLIRSLKKSMGPEDRPHVA
jgi:hypothetical protein